MEVKKGSCHCGAVEFKVKITDGFGELRRCDCSLCKKKGAIMASVNLENLEVIKGLDNLSLYQWNTGIAKHYFCKTCGIYTHHKRRSAPNEYAYNVACIDDAEAIQEDSVVMLNGAKNSLV